MSILHAALQRSRQGGGASRSGNADPSGNQTDVESEAGPAVGTEIGQEQVRTYLEAASPRRRARIGPLRLFIYIVLGSAAGSVLAVTQTSAPVPQRMLAWLEPLQQQVVQQIGPGSTSQSPPQPQRPAIRVAAPESDPTRPLPGHARRGLPSTSGTDDTAGIGVAAAVAPHPASGQHVAEPAIAVTRAPSLEPAPDMPAPAVGLALARQEASKTAAATATDAGEASAATQGGEAETGVDDRNGDAIDVTVEDEASQAEPSAPQGAGDSPTQLVPDGTMSLPGDRDIKRTTQTDNKAAETGAGAATNEQDAAESTNEAATEPVDQGISSVSDRNIEVPRVDPTQRRAARTLRTGSPAEAARLFRRILEDAPNKPDALFGLALAQQRTGDHEAARTTYRKLLKVEPSNQRAMHNLVGLAAQGPPGTALQRLGNVREAHPNVAQVHARLARTHLRADDPEAAARAMQRAVSLAPSNVRYRHDLAVLQDRANNRRRAIAAYRRVLSADAGALREANVDPAAVRRRLRHLSR